MPHKFYIIVDRRILRPHDTRSQGQNIGELVDNLGYESIVDEVRAELLESLKQVPKVLGELIKSRDTPAGTRLQACRDLMDRFGPYAVKASLNQTLVGTVGVRQLLASKQKLVEEERKLSQEIKEVRLLLGRKDATDKERQENSSGNEKGVRVGKRRKGILRIDQQREDQGSA